MSRRAFTLPLRVVSETRRTQAPWICRRCLTTDTTTASSSSSSGINELPPSIPPTTTRSSHSTPSAQTTTLPSQGQRKAWLKTLPYLGQPLPSPIPMQYLMYCKVDALTEAERAEKAKVNHGRSLRGVVVSAGKMQKTVRVRIPGKTWNKKIGKYYDDYTSYMVSDPNSSLLEGDVVEIHRLRVSKRVNHIIASIVTPFSKPISERPPIPTPEERLNEYKQYRFSKLHRRNLRLLADNGDQDAEIELRAIYGIEEPTDEEYFEAEAKSTALAKTTKSDLRVELSEADRVVARRAFMELEERKKRVLEQGRTNLRAKRNIELAARMDEKAERNLLEAREKREELAEERGVAAESVIPGKK